MSDAADLLAKAKTRYRHCVDGWSEVYTGAKEDLHFLSDAEGSQWDSREWSDRTNVGRPAIQIDQLTQFCHQVVNDIRMNTPTIKIIPADLDSDPETAEILEGRIKAIEYKSLADSAYDTAVDFAVKGSIGFIRVDRRYIDDESFEQELIIKRVVNPLSYYIDCNSVEPDGSDAKYAFVLDEIPEATFKEQWPDAAPVSFDVDPDKNTGKEQYITICEYFVIEEEDEYIGVTPDGKREKVDGRKKYVNKRKMKKRTVKHYKLAGEDILEETVFPGKYIPIVPVFGEEAWRDGKRHVYSLIRKSKGAQRMFNALASLELELLYKQPEAPVMAAEGQMAGYEEDWKQSDKAKVLYYKQRDIEGNQAPAPIRLNPPQASSAVINAKASMVDNIKATLGMYNASIGQRSNETSGRAIEARKLEGDVATYHFGDNLVKSVAQVGKIIVSALPEIEDSERIVNIVDKEDNFKLVGINGAMLKDQERPYYIKGKWDVRVITGAPFTTQRQEAAALYNQTIQAMPDLMPVIGDLVFKYQDAPGAQAISERLKKLVDPKLLEEDKQNGQAQQMQAMQAQMQQVVAEAQAQIQALQAELQSKQADAQVKMAEVQIKAQEVEIKKGELQLKLIQAQKGEPVDDSFDRQLKAKELEIKAFDAETKRIAATQKPVDPNVAIKLDTTGFQMMKTPEQLQLEEQEMFMRSQESQAKLEMEAAELQQKEQEAQMKMTQTQMVIESLMGIQQQLGQLTSAVTQPISVIRDEQGNLIGAN